MTEDPSARDAAADSEEALPPHRIEQAKSSRSKCRTCRRKIDKDVLRLGVLLVGPYGTGYLWHHLTCAARRQFTAVEEAYRERAWDEGLEVPTLDSLRAVREKADRAKQERRTPPWAERAPTGRAKCKHCDEPIAKGAWRIVLGRSVAFGSQVRTSPINLHPGCVSAEMRADDCATSPEGFAEALRAGSPELSAPELEECLTAVGELDD